MTPEDVAAKGATAKGKRQVGLENSVRWPTPTQPYGTNRGGSDANDPRGWSRNGKPRPSLEGAIHWPTPQERDRKDSGPTQGNRESPNLGTVVHWPTPRAEDSESTGAHGTVPDTLTSAARLWPTPQSEPESKASHGQLSGNFRQAMEKALEWATPSASVDSGSRNLEGSKAHPGISLSDQVIGGQQNRRETKPGVLNPSWVEILMGLPEGWTDVGPPLPARSSRGSRRVPSKEEPPEGGHD